MNTDRSGMRIMNSEYSEILTKLRGLSYRHFEQFVADVWQERQGWSTEVSSPGADGGLDVMGQPPDGGPKTALQCKRNQEGNKVSSRRVQQYSALRNQWTDVEGVTIVTTSEFTKNAKEMADRLDVRLINGERLVQLIQRYNAEEILEWYVQGKPEDW